MRFLFVLFVFVTTLAVGQSTSVRPFPMEERTLLWEISGPNVEKNCYLFGTIHLIEKEAFYFPKKLDKIVRKSELVVLELGEMPNQMEAMQLMMLKEGSFFDYFDAAQTDSVLVWAQEKMSMNEQTFRMAFSKMKPFAVSQVATQMELMGKTESYDMNIMQIAKEETIETKGLETIEFQMSMFDSLSKEQQAEMVMMAVRDTTDGQLFKEMQAVYLDQNLDSLYTMIHSEGGVFAEEEANLLDNRNLNWVPQIEEMISEKSTFIAVGAGHLGGPKGVIRLLEEKGYTLKPVKL